ncbi:VOC family protein [Rhizobium sp. 2MFCol3.1]|uniref:VOC family protein n=1 Tax=Rhizobium sp. 2MFCol3.1 TaxID=1246459 RepID=UPI00035F6A48|nr:VOC family protein [Rhizobium sp. 2MFCol3.1]
MVISRRHLLQLAGVSSLAAAFNHAVKAEAGAMPASADLPYGVTTAAHIKSAALRVRDLPGMSRFYQDTLRLKVLAESADEIMLGVENEPLLYLTSVPDAGFEDPTSAGLFHIAYLMPTRLDLARWLVHAAFAKIPLDGFADHSVSEAIYLTDPEGNGIEVYSDRPRDKWQWKDGIVTMGTNELDIDAIAALTDMSKDTYDAAPEGLRIGHIHLRVGDVDEANGFYRDLLCLDTTSAERDNAAFLSSGGYHHHVAVNTWRSAGAGGRDSSKTGLSWFSLTVSEPLLYEKQIKRFNTAGIGGHVPGGYIATDPWGTEVRLIKA